MAAKIINRLAELRSARGVSVQTIAKEAGVTRQSIHAIETGEYIPNTEVALRLARALDVSVEELFALPGSTRDRFAPIRAEIVSRSAGIERSPVTRLCKVGPRWMSYPVEAGPYYLPLSDGVVTAIPDGVAEVQLVGELDENRIVLAGCDPAAGMLSRMVAKTSGVEVLLAPASSRQAIEWLVTGKVHVAGAHLRDYENYQDADFNLWYLKRTYPKEEFAVFTLAMWEMGLAVADGNPLRIRTAGHLERKDVRFMNREEGSGGRAMLDRVLGAVGLTPKQVPGYNNVRHGHVAAAYAVASGEADCCMTTHSAAMVCGLEFKSLHGERYDLIVKRSMLDLPGVQALLDTLQRREMRTQLASFALYNVSKTGRRVA